MSVCFKKLNIFKFTYLTKKCVIKQKITTASTPKIAFTNTYIRKSQHWCQWRQQKTKLFYSFVKLKKVMKILRVSCFTQQITMVMNIMIMIEVWKKVLFHFSFFYVWISIISSNKILWFSQKCIIVSKKKSGKMV